ncbi:MAG: FkbM family methyltransferase [Planctomycetota bacterium]|nr:FkbM family methyltransferase [Planctomycetota bacterium]MEC8337421.1 FkbM family methyltransferase [Planctomycetota bacterium]
MQNHLRKIRRTWKYLRAKWGMKVFKYRPLVNLKAAQMGLSATSEVFANYIARHETQEHEEIDSELDEFIQFYAENYRESCSQWSQDIFVLFKSKKKTAGSYLEIGGADGVAGSNTLMLHNRFDWKGVLVEPDPEQFRYLQLNRASGDRLFNVAIAPDAGQQQVAFATAGQLSGIVGYQADDLHADARARSMARERPVMVSTMSINEILSSFSELDYFSLDVEGCEYQILSQVDWENTVKPRLITVEHNHVQETKEKISSLLELQGYRRVFARHEWLTRGDFWFELPPSKAA